MTRRQLLAAMLAGPLAGAVRAQETDLTALTIAQAFARMANREITPLQLVNAYLARIAKLDEDLNVYITVTADAARREARRMPAPGNTLLQPLHGIPIAHKDLFETRGVRTTAGSLLFEDYIPEIDADIVARLHAAGAIMLGKTNTHELGGGVTTINPFFGATRNPIDPARIAGGSSGGSAAAVAARMSAAATGSDTGGSVRIPAAFCGVVGFKPGYGRFSTRGLLGSVPTFDHVGFVTRTVEDAQIIVDGPRPQPPATIRVGVPRNYFFDNLEPAVAATVTTAVANLRARATVVDIDFPIDDKTMGRVFDPIVVFEIWGRFGADWRTNPGSFSKAFSAFFSNERPSVAEYESALFALKQYQSAVDAVFDKVDVIATPTVPVTPPLISASIDGMRILRNTWPFNAAGTPAISVPLPVSPLPVGLQLIARRGDDDKLLQIVRSLFPGV